MLEFCVFCLISGQSHVHERPHPGPCGLRSGGHSLCNDAEWFLLKGFTEAMALIYIPPDQDFPESMIERLKLVFA